MNDLLSARRISMHIGAVAVVAFKFDSFFIVHESWEKNNFKLINQKENENSTLEASKMKMDFQMSGRCVCAGVCVCVGANVCVSKAGTDEIS